MKALLAVDGGEAAVHARRLLSRLADRDEVEIVVCAVASFDMAMKEAAYSGHYSADDARHHAETVAADAEEELREDGFRVEVAVPDGDPAAELLRESNERAADLIVLGTGRETRLEAAVLGSTSLGILHGADRGVLIVHTAHDVDRPLRALVAADGSEGAALARALFARLADPSRVNVTVDAVAKPRGLPGVQGVDEAALEAARMVAHEAAAGLRDVGFTVDEVVERGRPGSLLLDRAHASDVDLVVAGSRGLSGLRAMALGSVSEQLVRGARAALIGR